MTSTDHNLSERLLKIAAEISQIAKEIGQSDGDVAFPAFAAEKVAKRICLQRGTKVPAKAKYTRGLSQAAYADTMRRIESCEFSEADLISKGLLAPRDKPGRKRGKSKLDELASEFDQLKDAAKQASKRTNQK